MPAHDALLARAKRRARQKTGFYSHAIIYLLVIGGLLLIDLLQGGGINWAYWSAMGWGLGLLSHGAVTFFNGAGLYERVLAHELKKLQEQER
ncbi:2TM domain-containing protein [Chitinimonas viridis]|uniref:2TM domain-containing protein n=1 Tax=Chitinimonas viridis TaxID=664880 RepID=A0ABT8AZH6_9NEIS|nr:2TM domain-containing protein [Chitinimonas viridis]MDN3575387.1 2TM domain-containing protein [Chitinimonas viridis]